MSDDSSVSNPPVRARKVKSKSEEDMVRDILRIQKQLLIQHKTPTLFTYPSKFGQLQFGSNNAVNKFKRAFAADKEWAEAFDDDDGELVHGDQRHEVDPDQDDLNEAKASVLPKKLPAEVSLMNYTELWGWLTEEILKEYWTKGGKLKCVKFGNQDFEPSFWLGEVWEWTDVKKHPKDLIKSDYKGPGNMTEYLKKVVINKLELLGINPTMWVKAQFGENERKRRERNRKKSTPMEVETALENGNGGGVVEENENPDLMHETFIQEADLEEETDRDVASATVNMSNISNILFQNGVDMNDLSGISGLAQGFETSSRNGGLERRYSARQAEKRARLESVSEEPCVTTDRPTLPRALSPLSNGSESGQAGPGGSPTATTATPPSSPVSPPPVKRFIPRRKPLEKNQSSNFKSHLNVNVGEELSRNTVTNLLIPSDLISKFENLSKPNTEKGVETGGIIAGKHIGTGTGSYFQVTHLLIPQQISASDRWEVQDERQITNLFTYNPDLTMLGLIHTHPRMDSFLSSVDLHALHDYARSNPSLISIVLAPERGTSPAFCLTTFGMKEIRKCRATGFHQHDNSHLMYKEADHTYDDESTETQVEDFRLD